MLDSLIKPTVMLLVATAFVLAFQRSKFFLPLYIASIPIIPLYQRQLTGSVSNVYDEITLYKLAAQMALFFALCVYYAGVLIRPSAWVPMPATCRRFIWAFLFFVIANFLIIPASVRPLESTYLVIIGVLGPFLLFHSILLASKNHWLRLNYALWGMTAGSVAYVVIGGVFRYMKAIETGSVDLVELRGYGGIYGGNSVDQVLALLIPLGFASSLPLMSGTNLSRRIYAIATMIWISLSLSRTGYAILAFGFLATLLIAPGRKFLVLGTVVLALSGYWWMGGLLTEVGWDVQARYAGASGSILETSLRDQRFDTWREAFAIFWERPLFGVGIGNFMEFSSEGFSNAHNLFLNTLAERGSIGLGILCYLLWSYFWLAFKADRSMVTSQHRTLGRLLALGVGLFVISSTTGDDLVQAKGFTSAVKAYYLAAAFGIHLLLFQAISCNSNPKGARRPVDQAVGDGAPVGG
jgi:O-antigen ligase